MSNAMDVTKRDPAGQMDIPGGPDPFLDPVTYLGALGLEAELVESLDRPLPAAA